METNNDIDDLFKDIVEPNEMNHSDKVWESLNYHLEKKANEKNKAIIFRLRIAVGVLLFLFSSFTLYYFFNSGESNKSLVAFSENNPKTNSLPIEQKSLNTIENIVYNNTSTQTKTISTQDKASTIQAEKSTTPVGLIHSTCTNGSFFYVREFSRSIYFDKGLDGQNMQLVVEPAFGHSQGDTAFVFVQSLDKNSAEFYDNLDKQKLAQYNPFIEPVFLKTKIVGCIGVFGSAVVSDSLLFVYPE